MVALLAEGVDRNKGLPILSEKRARSPSSRRAWIEMAPPSVTRLYRCVALLAEGVDRNR